MITITTTMMNIMQFEGECESTCNHSQYKALSLRKMIIVFSPQICSHPTILVTHVGEAMSYHSF